MGLGRGVRWVAPFFVASSFFACNALLDNESDRRVDTSREAGVDRELNEAQTDREEKGDDPVVIPSTEGGDAPAPITINVPLSFITPNGAVFGPADGGAGISITGTVGANHPVIIPIQQPAIPSDDYTVEAVVRTYTNCEYGIMTRMLADAGGGQLLGSKYGGETKPFIGNMGHSDWNPPNDSSGPQYTWSAGRYYMRVQAKGSDIKGMIWKDGEPTPPDWQTGVINAKYKTGRGVGFYVYFCYDAALESLKVTVP